MPNHEESWIAPFIGALEAVRKAGNRSTLAKLRRGLTNQPAERDIWVYAHLSGAGPQHEDVALLIAAIFALHPMEGGAGTLGAAFRRIRTDNGAESLDKRLAQLLDSHPDDLPARLRHAVSLLKSKEVPIDWRQLLVNLLDWDRPHRPVQRQWARDYWAARTTESDEANSEKEQSDAHNERSVHP